MAGSAADQFLELSKRLKATGQKELRNELNGAMRRTAKPLIPKVRAAARQRFPTEGGINVHYATKPMRAQTRTGALTAGVRVVMPKTDPRVDSQGRIYHPVFGRKPGVVQRFPAVVGFFSETLRGSAPAISADLEKAVRDFLDRVVQDGKLSG